MAMDGYWTVAVRTTCVAAMTSLTPSRLSIPGAPLSCVQTAHQLKLLEKEQLPFS